MTANPKDGRCRFIKDDGGRRQSGLARGRRDRIGDCVVRAIAIAAQMPYRDVHDALTAATVRHVAAGGSDWARLVRRHGRVRHFHADHGVADEVFGPYLKSLGWRFKPTKGKGVHLRADELPRGRLIVQVPKHLVAVVDGVIHDTDDCSNEGRRCVQGFWRMAKRNAAR
jgi:hypothetical protein